MRLSRDRSRSARYTVDVRPSVYLETSVVSYLGARPSRDLVTAARQQITHEWWLRRRPQFDVYVSELVRAEAGAGDPDAVVRRGSFIRDLRSLDVASNATALARAILTEARLPPRAGADALHVAIAACHGIEYLLTWNLTHIANAELRPVLEAACRKSGYEPAVMCTPDELMGD